MKIVNVVGARPNFMKIAPLLREMRRHPELRPILVHTGQHYDLNMAGQFFQDLQLPRPDVSLDVGSGSHAYQTAEVMRRIEGIFEQERPDLVVVVGDVNSTLAAALTAAKLQIPVAHIEAGLRSFDRSMPEEINRILTDALSEYLFVTEDSGRANLLAEGVLDEKIFLVGNVMIDSLESTRAAWDRSMIHARLGLTRGTYGVLTLHRPSNVDNLADLENLIGAVAEIARRIPIIFPVHPRTHRRLENLDVTRLVFSFSEGSAPQGVIRALDPLGYLDFMALVSGAQLVLTDSGGLQEETTALGVPCLTLRDTTERPVTVTHGTNRVVGSSPIHILDETHRILDREPHGVSPARPPLWDGKAAERIVAILLGRWKGDRLALETTATLKRSASMNEAPRVQQQQVGVTHT